MNTAATEPSAAVRKAGLLLPVLRRSAESWGNHHCAGELRRAIELIEDLSAPAAAVGGDDLLGNSIAQAYEEARVGQVFDCANDAFDWIEERAREINGVASSEKPCLRCGDARRILSGPRSFGEVTTIPCPDCNLYRDDYISGAELESRLDTLVEEYEWDDGESRHVPTETERLLLVDFAHGILADELFVAMLKAHYDPNSRNRPAAPVGGFVVDRKNPPPNWCRTCGKHRDANDAVFCSDAIHLKQSPTAQPSAKDGVRGEAVELTKCCGREECGGECGNEWRGTEWVRKATPAAGLVDEAMVERAANWLVDNALVKWDNMGQRVEPMAYMVHARKLLEAAIGREVGP